MHVCEHEHEHVHAVLLRVGPSISNDFFFALIQLSDFGLAITSGTQNKNNLKLSGTVGYVAPEYLLDGMPKLFLLISATSIRVLFLFLFLFFIREAQAYDKCRLASSFCFLQYISLIICSFVLYVNPLSFCHVLEQSLF